MRNPYRQFVESIDRAAREAALLPLGQEFGKPSGNQAKNGPVALLFSPHPDDECITATLPLRLAREGGARVVNVAVTLGSRPERRKQRLRELHNACACLDFELVNLREHGLTQIDREHRATAPADWAEKVTTIKAVIEQWQPQFAFFPHGKDGHSTHEGTHLLVVDALRGMPNLFQCNVFETEFWHPLEHPNLMVEASVSLVAEQVLATSCHQGEVERNPYHLNLPFWMRDNLRRGTELVGGQGGAMPNFGFATLYRHSLWQNGRLSAEPGQSRIVSLEQCPDFNRFRAEQNAPLKPAGETRGVSSPDLNLTPFC